MTTPTTTEPALLPCPFCGAAAKFHNDGGHGLGNIVTSIQCTGIYCLVAPHTAYLDRWEAIKTWNRRIAP